MNITKVTTQRFLEALFEYLQVRLGHLFFRVRSAYVGWNLERAFDVQAYAHWSIDEWADMAEEHFTWQGDLSFTQSRLMSTWRTLSGYVPF